MISGEAKMAAFSKVPFIYSDSYSDTSKTRAQFTLSDRHAGMTLGEIAAQAATSGECEAANSPNSPF